MRYVLDQSDREWSKHHAAVFQPTSRMGRDRLMTIPLRVLVLEGSPTDAEVMLDHLGQARYALDWWRVETEADYLVYRFTNIFTLESMSKIEFLPSMHHRRSIDFPNS